MNRIPLIALVAAAAALAGCNNSNDHNIVAGGPADPMANQLANAPPVTLPPSIDASKIYRCKDNSVVYIDWLSDKKSANYRSKKDDTPIQLMGTAAGQPLKGTGGYSLKGSATGSTVTLERPGKGSQECKA